MYHLGAMELCDEGVGRLGLVWKARGREGFSDWACAGGSSRKLVDRKGYWILGIWREGVPGCEARLKVCEPNVLCDGILADCCSEAVVDLSRTMTPFPWGFCKCRSKWMWSWRVWSSLNVAA
jgi:hypothetical protein